jgi:hypothetical protein
MCFHGERLDTHTGLYQMMPLKLRTNLDEQLKGWTAGRNIRVENLDQRPHLLGQRMEVGSCFPRRAVIRVRVQSTRVLTRAPSKSRISLGVEVASAHRCWRFSVRWTVLVCIWLH